ncbi:2,5-diamino-6-ribosylamino-4(3H)-pyrimidinone 5'-phosphate reductase [Actinomadura rubteroloni]|uniref:2,5-diamino-6-ribosylamino-4(3H)-pyrimidinone 5'-phosphate reductase n=1 Tax=Actinomadura rubteroloni TaxID=1926885 RepID=A0A2P4UD60_9ACTN|nr:dihydrofolate reductase family protein [Actinomadura rubteroloni]POM22956.1 2,5-diamino-6-ribosylamino-4(3H)-pyrimidinone 5'-phosphate reductase [Actinomadura rubteroloni]
MRRLLPSPAASVDPYDEYGADVPPLRIGMVASLDGTVTDAEGWTDGLGGAADFRVFRVLRALAGAILVGASTVRTRRLGPARLSAELRERRGGPPAPIVVVSRSLDLDWTLPLFTAAETPTLVVTCASALSGRRLPVPAVVAGDDAVDLGAAVRSLRDDHGLDRLLCEGGPALTTSLVRAGLADELCLNLAPALHGSAHHTPLLGALDAEVPVRPAAVYEDDGVLFLRYRLR